MMFLVEQKESPQSLTDEQGEFLQNRPFIFGVSLQQRSYNPRGMNRGNLPRRADAMKTIMYFKIWNTLFQ